MGRHRDEQGKSLRGGHVHAPGTSSAPLPSSYSHWGGYQMHNLYSRHARRQKDYPRITDLPHRREKYKFRNPDKAFRTRLGVLPPLIFYSHISGGKTGEASWTHANPSSQPPPFPRRKSSLPTREQCSHSLPGFIPQFPDRGCGLPRYGWGLARYEAAPRSFHLAIGAPPFWAGPTQTCVLDLLSP